MDAKKQAYIADALTKEITIEVPVLERQVPSFLRSMIPPMPADAAAKAGAELAKVAAKASDDWDVANAEKPAS